MITEKQHQTFIFIKQYIQDNGYAPTTAEIALGIGIQSRGVVHRYLQALQNLGLITLAAGKRRNITINRTTTLPLIGKIAAGLPIEAIDNAEELDILSMFIGDGRYALEVKGDSMIDEGIFEGDIVVCQKANTASANDIVVALVDNENATLKRLKNNQDGTVTLIPSNENHQPQTYAAERVAIQGILWVCYVYHNVRRLYDYSNTIYLILSTPLDFIQPYDYITIPAFSIALSPKNMCVVYIQTDC